MTTKTSIQEHIREASMGYANTKSCLARSVYHAVLTGIHLIILKTEFESNKVVPRGTTLGRNSTGEGFQTEFESNELVPRGTNSSSRGQHSKGNGFKGTLAEIGIAPRTAYRWMNAAAAILCQQQQSESPDISAIPAINTVEWTKFLCSIQEIAEHSTLSRLALGACAKGDILRHDELISKAEAGNNHAIVILGKVEDGELTLIQATRALAGIESTKGQERQPVIYCDIDPKSGKLIGTAPSSLISLRNALANYASWSKSAQKAFRDEWRSFVNQLPHGI